MESDVIGRVDNTRLPTSNSLHPLFEAVVNSIYAIDEAQISNGRIDVSIVRDPQEMLGGELGAAHVPAIDGFRILDNGIGFTEVNYVSFQTLDSRIKAARGAKGIGRLLWLKAFEDVHIESTFEEHGEWYQRVFDFRRSKSGIEGDRIEETKSTSRSTEVHLKGFRKRYQAASPKRAEPIARRLVEHCLEHFVLGTAPRIFVHDEFSPDVTIDVQELYQREYRPAAAPRAFSLNGQEFQILDVLLKPSSATSNQLHFCAHNRAVDKFALRETIPHLDAPLTDEAGQQQFYSGYITSSVLDNAVDAERTGFNLDHRGELALSDREITWEDLIEAAVDAAAEFLSPRTESAKQNAFQRAREFIEHVAPQYRPLLSHRRNDLERLSQNLSDERLDLELHKMSNRLREAVRQDVQDSLSEIDSPEIELEAHKQRVEKALGQIHELAQSDLAHYVRHRWTVLSFFDKLLGRQTDGKFALEEALHSLFFPQRKSSNEVEFNHHNLWILDDRLAFHSFLASDIPFSAQSGAPVEVDGVGRPDVLVYFNAATAFTPDENRSSIAVVEFKRPERAGYAADDSPLGQVLEYAEKIRKGKARAKDGSSMTPLEHRPFYCYVVATLNESLRQQAKQINLVPSPNDDGFFGYNANYHAYIEVIDYKRLLVDAKQRNRAFFDALGMPTPSGKF